MESLFINKIDAEKYKSTNELWNNLNLNTSWSIGQVTKLIKDKSIKKKEDWYNFYFESGEQRKQILSKLPQNESTILNSLNPSNYYGHNKNLNTDYGRTKQEICKKGIILYENMKKLTDVDITLKECEYISFFRVIGETWNGIVMRENNTKENLMNIIKNHGFDIIIIDTLPDFDINYAVDFELYYDGKIICGLQIKPPSYHASKSKYIENSMKLNNEKNKSYTAKFHRDVYYIYSKTDGEICNGHIINDILNDIKKNH